MKQIFAALMMGSMMTFALPVQASTVLTFEDFNPTEAYEPVGIYNGFIFQRFELVHRTDLALYGADAGVTSGDYAIVNDHSAVDAIGGGGRSHDAIVADDLQPFLFQSLQISSAWVAEAQVTVHGYGIDSDYQKTFTVYNDRSTLVSLDWNVVGIALEVGGTALVLDDMRFAAVAPVPLPASGVLLLVALGAGAAMARRRAA